MVDAAVVMIENAHKRLERWDHDHPAKRSKRAALQVITEAAAEVGPALFFSLLIITLSFVPVSPCSAGGSSVRAAGLHQNLRHGAAAILS